MQILPKFSTKYYYVNVDLKEDGVGAIYETRVRARVDTVSDIGISLAWPNKNQFMCVASGYISFVCDVSDEIIKADPANPPEADDKRYMVYSRRPRS